MTQTRKISRRHWVGLVGEGLGYVVGFSSLPRPLWAGPAQTGRRQRTNFILFLADDLGWADLACYGSRFYETPNLDRLAASGMRFSAAYAACPVCSPTRAAIMTGKYPARLGLTNFLPGRHTLPYSRLIAPGFHQELALPEVTIAEALAAAGYRTGCFGKWHLGGAGYGPGDQGFGSNAGNAGRNNIPLVEPGASLPANPPGLTSDRLTDHALRFLEQSPREPFFLYLPFYDVHIPLETRREYEDKYRRKAASGGAQGDPVYAGMVQAVDDNVGRVVRKVEELGLADRTLFIFTSDNGGLTVPEWRCITPTSNAPLRAGKGHLYEGGIRVPLIMRWPQMISAGSECDVPVTSTDFSPTMAEIAGLNRTIGEPADGVSLVPLLTRKDAIRRDTIYWHYPHYSNQGGLPSGAIRQGDYKLIEFYEDGHCELYHLKEDIGESRDLAATMPAKAKSLQDALRRWRQEMRAVMPQPNPAFDPSRQLEGDGVRWRRDCLR